MFGRRGLGDTHLFGTLYSDNLDLIIISPNVHNLIIIWESLNLRLIKCKSTYSYVVLARVLFVSIIIIFLFTAALLITSLALRLFLRAFYCTVGFLIMFFIGRRSGMFERTRTWLQWGNVFPTSRRTSGCGRNLFGG